MPSIELSEQATKQSIASLRRYFDEELDHEIGDLKAQLLLEFIVKEIGPSIYNAAVADAQTFMRDRVADLENVCYVPEFAYWGANSVRRAR